MKVYTVYLKTKVKAVHGLLINLRRIWQEEIYYTVLLQWTGVFYQECSVSGVFCIRNVLLYLECSPVSLFYYISMCTHVSMIIFFLDSQKFSTVLVFNTSNGM